MKYIALFALIGLVALANASTPFDSANNQEDPFPYAANLPLSLRVKNPTLGTVVTLSDTDATPGFEAKFTLTSASSSEVSFGGTALTVPVPAGSTDFVVVFIVTATDATTVSFSAVLYTNTGSSSSAGNTAATSSSAPVGDVKLTVTGGTAGRVTVYPYPYVLSQNEASAIFGANGNCFDFVQNPGETAVDCGGTCTACTCSDTVQNQGEFGTDCGFPCFGQCSGILDVPFDSFDGTSTSGVQSFSGRTPDAGEFQGSLATQNTEARPPFRLGVLYFQDNGSGQPIGNLVPVTFAPKFTARVIASFGGSDPADNENLLNCDDALFLFVNFETLKATVRGQTVTLAGLPAGVALGADFADILVVVTATSISGSVHFGAGTSVPFSVAISPPNAAPSSAIQCKLGNTISDYGVYYDRVTIYNGLALSSVQQNEMYDFAPALGHCADGVANSGETGVDCGSVCSRVCPTDDGGNGGGNNGNTCPNCAAGTNLQVIASSGIRGGEYGLVSTSGTCITVRVRA